MRFCPSNSETAQVKTACYALPLRAIGQALEVLRIGAFELERNGDDYFVRIQAGKLDRNGLPSWGLEHSRIQVSGEGLLRKLYQKRKTSGTEPHPMSFELRYTSEDIKRLDQEGRERRGEGHGIPNGHRMSELLRAAGDYVDQKKAQMLGISWQDQSIGIVYETAEGHRKLEVFSFPNMYDFWLLMQLRRMATSVLD